MVDKCKLCTVFSLVATALLSLLGIALISDYDYLPVSSNRETAAVTCFSAAGIYALIGVISLVIVLRREKTRAKRRTSEWQRREVLVEMQCESGSTLQAEGKAEEGSQI